jgi:tape measure domain-containing protein
MADSLRELVTVLRYQLQDGELKKYVDGFQQAQKTVQQAADVVRGRLQPAVDAVRGKLQAAVAPAREIGQGLAQGARQGAREAISSLDRIEARARRLRRESQAAGNAIGSAITSRISMLLAGVGVHQLMEMSDEWQGEQSAIGLYTDNRAQRDRSRDYLFNQAQRSGNDYAALAGTFTQINPGLRHEGFTNDQILVLTDTLSKAGALGKGGPEGTKNALVQFAQAVAKGSLQWADFKLIEQQSEGITQAITNAMGMSQTELLTKMQAKGKGGKVEGIDIKSVTSALLGYADTVDKKFASIPQTFGQGMTRIKNALVRQVGLWNEQYGIAEKFGKATEWIADHMDQIGKATAAIVGLWAGSKLLGGLRLIGAYLRPLLLFGVRLGQGKTAMAFAKLGTSGLQFLKMLRWIGAAIAAIGGIGLGPLLLIGAALAAAAVLVYKYWEPIKAFFKGVWEGLTSGLSGVGAQLQAAFAPLGPAFEQLGQWLGEAFDWLVKLIAPADMTGDELDSATGKGIAFGRAIATWIEIAITNVGFLIDRFVALGTWIGETAAKIVIGFGNAWDAVKNGVSALWTWLVSKFTAGWDMLSGMVPGWLKSGVGALMGGGGAALNVSTGQVQNTGRAVNQTVTQQAQVTVNAPGATNPAAVGRAAGDGVTQAQQRIAAAGRVYAPHTTTEAAP